MRSPSFTPYQNSDSNRGTSNRSVAQGAADFLRANDKMASILPAVTRMAALQKDCAASLSSMFSACSVLQFESEQLVLSVPNAAIAAKLKQQLPKLQASLLKLGWQVSAIRLKVQASQFIEKSRTSKSLLLPDPAVLAFFNLNAVLENSPRNAALKAALTAMLHRQRGSEPQAQVMEGDPKPADKS
ncbi:hypothetical protein BH11PSE11_BH11PSE11_00600 [soil metagenome]